MALSNYNGPPGYVAVLPHLVGETITMTFVDASGHIWLVVKSGEAFVIAGHDPNAPAPYWIAKVPEVEAAKTERRRQLQDQIQAVKNLAPGLDV